ncbi:hypothetical protein SC1083_1289 [Aggregatibacter actinomycetemcomitans serotype e str. SC1083]|uniref:Uncharacterized protein n=1 Tax=Aggregatibacter actinomycetemcomitans serotype e str. SC1083 TaxID=907488 RepID=G4A8Y3_AGGAC|nr:hypothetical protein SC1083_1289 [Aggregatibacter actinomycetemcomitans serotype e str. SC1083]
MRLKKHLDFPLHFFMLLYKLNVFIALNHLYQTKKSFLIFSFFSFFLPK